MTSENAAQTVIVGAGPAGLAVGGCLRRAGITSVILEREDRVGASWHRHYDRLHLPTLAKAGEKSLEGCTSVDFMPPLMGMLRQIAREAKRIAWDITCEHAGVRSI